MVRFSSFITHRESTLHDITSWGMNWVKSNEVLYPILYPIDNKKRINLTLIPLFCEGGRAVSNRRPPEPQSGALTNNSNPQC